MSFDTLKSKIIQFWIPLVFTVLTCLVGFFDLDLYIRLVLEDGWIENLQVVALLACTGVGLWTLVSMRRHGSDKLGYFLIAAFTFGTFFIAGEEISWGQRIFGIETPEKLKQINYQSEFNIHNLSGINELIYRFKLLIGLFGAIAWYLFAKRPPRTSLRSLWLLVPPKGLWLYFLLPGIYGAYHGLPFVRPQDQVLGLPAPLWRYQEPMELLLFSGFLLVALANLERVKTKYFETY